jgi:putative ATPase
LLGAVESGVLTLIAATTENPSFSIIKPLISRSLVINLTPLTESDVRSLLLRALSDDSLVSGSKFSDAALDFIVRVSSGDARRALSLLEAAANSSSVEVGIDEIKQIAQNSIAYDDGGDSHYDTISAFIKSVRGSDVDSALHYLARMIVGGEDPRFISRRLMIPLAEATIYLSLAPKSNSSYLAIDKAIEQVRDGFAPEVPAPLRSTGAIGYKYPHDHLAGIVKQDYSLAKDLFSPGELGYEKTLAERLRAIRRVLNGE